MRVTDALLQRFWSQVDRNGPGGCWLWAKPYSDGYGQFRGIGVHRFSWELLRGPIPEGLHIDHLCRVRNCVNPEHLEPVTPAENVRRAHVEEFRPHRPKSLTTFFILRVRQICAERGWTGTELAKRAGMPQTTISHKLLTANRISIADLAKLSTALNVAPEEIVREAQEMRAEALGE